MKIQEIKCNLCEGSRFVSLFAEGKTKDKLDAKILKCLDCGLVFIFPQTGGDKLSSHYQDEGAINKQDLKRLNKRLERLNSFLGKLVLKNILGYKNINLKTSVSGKAIGLILRGFFIKNIIRFRGEGRIVDIGCGTGLYLSLLKNIGWDTLGVEVNKHACEYARNLGVNVFCGELEQANLPPNYFDVVRIVHVLEHLSSPLQSFVEIKRILKPNGVIYLEIPNQRSFAFRCFKERWLGISSHLYAFSPVTISFLCEKTGLHIQRIEFKSSKGVLLNSFEYLWEDMFSRPFPHSILKNKVFHILIVDPLRFFLNQIHRGDTLVAEIIKKDFANDSQVEHCSKNTLN